MEVWATDGKEYFVSYLSRVHIYIYVCLSYDVCVCFNMCVTKTFKHVLSQYFSFDNLGLKIICSCRRRRCRYQEKQSLIKSLFKSKDFDKGMY